MGGLALVFAACVGVPCAIFYGLFRHWFFGALTLVPPLAVFASTIVFRRFDLNLALIASLFGTVCALSFGDRLVRGVSVGRHGHALASETCRLVILAVVPVLTAYALCLSAEVLVLRSWETSAQSVLFFVAGFAAAFGAGWLISFFPFSEQFVARANAAREWREQLLEQFFPPMQSRWAFSVAGIALILGTIAAFGIPDTHIDQAPRIWLCVVIGLAFLAAGFTAIARNWRMAASLTLAASFNGVLLCWALARRDRFLDPITVEATLFLACVPLCLTAACARGYLREGDDVASALSIAVRDAGAAAIALGAMTGWVGVGSTAVFLVLSPALVFSLSSMFAALLLFPALAVAIHSLFPHYRTVDEVFGGR